jgi:hypothetical protein
MFIFLNTLTNVKAGVSKKILRYFFYASVNLSLILNFINIYLCNVDIAINSLLLSKGTNAVGVFFSYNKAPIISELDVFFECVVSLLEYLAGITLSLRLYLRATTLLTAETFLRIFKVPVLLSK